MIWYSVAISFHVVASFLWVALAVHRILLAPPFVGGHAIGTRPPYSRAAGRWDWACVTVIVLTGVFVLYYQGVGAGDLSSGRIFAGSYGQLLGLKLLLSVVLIALQFMRTALRASGDWLVAGVGFGIIAVSAVMIR